MDSGVLGLQLGYVPGLNYRLGMSLLSEFGVNGLSLRALAVLLVITCFPSRD